MRVDTAELKSRYRALCEHKGQKCTKHGLRLFLNQARAIAAVHAKEQRGGLVTLTDAKRVGMPVKTKEAAP